MKKLVVTRHKALFDYLLEQGLIESDTESISHASIEDVRNKHVFGVLPYWLSSKADKYTEIQLRIPFDKRGKELTLEEIRFYALKDKTYKVMEIKENGKRR